MDRHNTLNELEELIRTETMPISNLRDPLDISRQLSAQAVKIAKNLEQARCRSGNSGVHELFFLAACLASKYRIPLSEIVPACRATDAHGVSNPRHEDFCQALSAIARETEETVLAYEGRILSPPKKGGAILAVCLAQVVEKVISVADLEDANLYDVVSGLIREKRDRAASLEYLYHPSDAPTLRSFETIQRKTECPYATAARLWGAPLWDSNKSINCNVRKISMPLGKFIHVLRWENLDGFVIEISDNRLVGDMVRLSRTLRLILKSLNSIDSFKPNLFDREVRSKEWYFEFLGARMFLIVFSPLYGHESSRETYGEKSTFIMLQPQQSFVGNKALRDDERNENRSTLVEKFAHRFANIRKRFADAGKPYDGPIMNAPFQAPRFIKPLRLDDPEIEWWKDD